MCGLYINIKVVVMRLKHFFSLTILFSAIYFPANAQVSDSIYKIPLGTERIDTIRFDSTNTIKFIEYIAKDKVLKRLFYSKDNIIKDAETYDDIGRSIWVISWYPNGKIERIFYDNYQIGFTWYEDGILNSESKNVNDTIVETYYYESSKVRKIIKTLPAYDSTDYRYLVTYCENGFKTSEEFSGKEYTYKSYYCSGKKRTECQKGPHGHFIGKYYKWDENGILILKGQFAPDENHTHYTTIQDQSFGQKEGKWRYYDDNGKLIKTEVYEKGKLLYTKNADGSIQK
jgi:antitoxin component YwqK of YwqJK toxin-antitoxin module